MTRDEHDGMTFEELDAYAAFMTGQIDLARDGEERGARPR